MVDAINSVNGSVSRPADSGPGVDAFLAKAAGGVGIEELILQDTREQQEAARTIRRAQREQRRKLVEQAVKKMKAAADNRFWSGFAGAVSGVAAELVEVLVQGKWTKVISEGTKFLGGNLAKHFLCDLPATNQECDAKLLQDAAQSASEAAQDNSGWLASVKDLERRMVDRIDQLTRAEHENQMSIMNRIGG